VTVGREKKKKVGIGLVKEEEWWMNKRWWIYVSCSVVIVGRSSRSGLMALVRVDGEGIGPD
jgi:hypothetical protein